MPTSDLSLLGLILAASPLVQVVMGILLLASVLSWSCIFDRARILHQAKRELRQFEKEFWSGRDLAVLYRTLRTETPTGGAAIFCAGFREYTRLQQAAVTSQQALIDGVQRAMRVALNREADRLEARLPFLATVGSSSPYIGLFGTVWGIMSAFQALGQVQQATLHLVAPGIAEALIATAMGLFAAIPAVIAYNRYQHTAQCLINRYDDFVDEFSNILQRQPYQAGATSDPQA
jgi:biopolymer transport protein TolQ